MLSGKDDFHNTGKNFLIRGCEISDCSEYGIYSDEGNDEVMIDHTYIHDIRMKGLSYGVWLQGKDPKIITHIHNSIIDHNGEAVDGQGGGNVDWDIRHCTFMPGALHNHDWKDIPQPYVRLNGVVSDNYCPIPGCNFYLENGNGDEETNDACTDFYDYKLSRGQVNIENSIFHGSVGYFNYHRHTYYDSGVLDSVNTKDSLIIRTNTIKSPQDAPDAFTNTVDLNYNG